MKKQLATINSIWIGSNLGPVHVACLKSFINHGHKVVLHSYKCPQDKPEKVEFADANLLIPEDQIVRHRETGSFSLFSNLLRYELLRKELGLYVDCDIFCLKPIIDAEYIVGFEDNNFINNAVLKLPSKCPALMDLCSIRDNNKYFPPWLSRTKRWKHRFKGLIRMGGRIEDLPWGSTGPKAITYFFQEYDLLDFVQPIDIFYPVNYDSTNLLLDQELEYTDLITNRTMCIHLWNSLFLDKLDFNQLPNCPLKELVCLGGID